MRLGLRRECSEAAYRENTVRARLAHWCVNRGEIEEKMVGECSEEHFKLFLRGALNLDEEVCFLLHMDHCQRCREKVYEARRHFKRKREKERVRAE